MIRLFISILVGKSFIHCARQTQWPSVVIIRNGPEIRILSAHRTGDQAVELLGFFLPADLKMAIWASLVTSAPVLLDKYPNDFMCPSAADEQSPLPALHQLKIADAHVQQAVGVFD